MGEEARRRLVGREERREVEVGIEEGSSADIFATLFLCFLLAMVCGGGGGCGCGCDDGGGCRVFPGLRRGGLFWFVTF